MVYMCLVLIDVLEQGEEFLLTWQWSKLCFVWSVGDVADRPRFGPAGMPLGFKVLKRPVGEVPMYLREKGLDAFEYQMVRWGPKPQIRREEAERLGRNAVKEDVWLTAHGSYFVNLTAEGEVLEASKRRLLSCVTGAGWMGARIVVFHPGFYGGRSPQRVFEICEGAMKEVVESMKSLGLGVVCLAPETMGKPSQFGSLDEVLGLCERLEFTVPNVDWAHLHARDRGRFRSVDDSRRVLDEIERRLGSDVLKNLYCHFSHIEFGDKGERRHVDLDVGGFGPDFGFLVGLFVELGLNPVVCCETPSLDVDALKLRDIVYEELKAKARM